MKKALSFKAKGRFAHFGKVECNTVKKTYRIMPRTTAEGLMAAVLGKPRDSYYDMFDPEHTQIAISNSKIRKINIPQHYLSTTESEVAEIGKGIRTVTSESTAKNRQIQDIEYLKDIEYQIDITTDKDFYKELKHRLSNNLSEYIPYLGKANCLCRLDFVGEYEVKSLPEGEYQVDSAVPESEAFILSFNGSGDVYDRTAHHMEKIKGGRRTLEYKNYAVNTEGGQIKVDSENVKEIGKRKVIMV